MIMLFLGDMAIVQFALWFSMHLRLSLPYGQDLSQLPQEIELYTPSIGLHITVLLIWMASFYFISLYISRKVFYWDEEFRRILAAHTIAALCCIGVLYLARIELSRLAYAYFYLTIFIGVIGYRMILRYWHRTQRIDTPEVSRILIVGANNAGTDIVHHLQNQNWSGYTPIGFLDDAWTHGQRVLEDLPILGSIEQAKLVIEENRVDNLIVALPRHAHEKLSQLVNNLQDTHVRINVVPDYFDLAFHGATVERLGDIPLIGLREPRLSNLQSFIKRLVDLAISFGALLSLLPIMCLVAIAIKSEDGGPIFYSAQRVGQNGRFFSMFKFRSMRVDADKLQHLVNRYDDEGNLLHKVENDPRITRVGRFIRRTSLDELPQLLNVLRGEMSLVGPRPELPWLVKDYEQWQYQRFSVPQGITGWWQVSGRSDNPMHLSTDLDLYYIQNYSIWLDFQIMLRTLSVVLRGSGAY